MGVGKKPKSSSKPKEGSIELRNKTQMAPNRKMKCEGKGDKSAPHFKVLKGKNANNKEKSRTQRGRPTHNLTLNRLLLHHSMLGHFVSEWEGWCPTWGSLSSYRRLCLLVGQCSQHQHPYKGKNQNETPSKPQQPSPAVLEL